MVRARPESVYHIQHQCVHARTQVLKSPLCTMIRYMWNLLLVPTPHLCMPLASFAQPHLALPGTVINIDSWEIQFIINIMISIFLISLPDAIGFKLPTWLFMIDIKKDMALNECRVFRYVSVIRINMCGQQEFNTITRQWSILNGLALRGKPVFKNIVYCITYTKRPNIARLLSTLSADDPPGQ